MARTTTEAINSYLTDMLALEEHIGTAIGAQAADLKGDAGSLAPALHDIERTIRRHIEELKRIIEARAAGAGNAVADVVKRAGASAAGLAAAAIDFVRNEKAPKDLRDDYTACSLAVVSYTMLLTTAVTLEDQEVADLANTHLRDYARVVMSLNELVPASVVQLLQEEGLPAHSGRLHDIHAMVKAAWTGDVEEATAHAHVGTFRP
jgi:ferritin-like metal-binding protein YciE